MALHTLKHDSRFLKKSSHGIHDSGDSACWKSKKKHECSLINMSLAKTGIERKEEKSVIKKNGDTLKFDYRFLHAFVKLRKPRKNIKNKIFWFILVGAIVTHVLNSV